MAAKYPKVWYSCPCSITTTSFAPSEANPTKDDTPQTGEPEEQTLDPTNPRSNFLLSPLEHLLFCNDCHEIRCERCYFEEALYYFCPGCLLETPGTTVKNETNRCTRSCFQCPVCTGALVTMSFQTTSEAAAATAAPSKKDGPFVLTCPHCAWSTIETGLRFEKSVNLATQLPKLPNGSSFFPVPDEPKSEEASLEEALRDSLGTPSTRFARLAGFYRTQLADTCAADPSAPATLDSPGQLTRLLSSYGLGGLKKPRGRAPVMREADGDAEGFEEDVEDPDLLRRLQDARWEGTLSVAQQARHDPAARFLSDLRPLPMPLRAKKAKRCRTCRNNLVRPEDKRQSSRYRIRLVAANYIPRIGVAALHASTDLAELRAGRTTHVKLTLRNPLFDDIRISLATARVTPGPVETRVTILCPQFEVDKTADVWDDALEGGVRGRDVVPAEGQGPEAGKVWEKRKNWTVVVLELVPGQVARRTLLEVPLFVRMEWDADDTDAAGTIGRSGRDRKVKRELGWWVVLTIGDIVPD